MSILALVEDRPTPKEVYNWKIYLLAAVASFTSCMIGYDSAFIGTTLALSSFREEFGFSTMSKTAVNLVSANIVSCYQAGAFFGAFSPTLLVTSGVGNGACYLPVRFSPLALVSCLVPTVIGGWACFMEGVFWPVLVSVRARISLPSTFRRWLHPRFVDDWLECTSWAGRLVVWWASGSMYAHPLLCHPSDANPCSTVSVKPWLPATSSGSFPLLCS